MKKARDAEGLGLVIAVALALSTLLVFASFAPARQPGPPHAAQVASIHGVFGDVRR